MNPIDWGNKDSGKPIRNYRIRLVDGTVQHMATTQTLAEVRLNHLGRYTGFGLAINIEEIEVTK